MLVARSQGQPMAKSVMSVSCPLRAHSTGRMRSSVDPDGRLAAGALDADEDHGAEASEPRQQPAVTGLVAGKDSTPSRSADGVQRGGDVDIEVGVDPSGGLIRERPATGVSPDGISCTAYSDPSFASSCLLDRTPGLTSTFAGSPS